MNNNLAPEWINQIENTIYSDKIFSKIGRLLFKASRFESYCKIASSVILAKTNPEILSNNLAFDEFLKTLEEKWLNENITNIKSVLTIQEIKGHLTSARKSRNALCHELTLGLENIFCDSIKEKELEKVIELHTKNIVTGEYYSILIACILTKEILPTMNYIKENIEWVLAD